MVSLLAGGTLLLLTSTAHAEAIRKASFGLVSDFQFVEHLKRDGFAVIRAFETAQSADSMMQVRSNLRNVHQPKRTGLEIVLQWL